MALQQLNWREVDRGVRRARRRANRVYRIGLARLVLVGLGVPVAGVVLAYLRLR